jgi:hypothetical protein
LSSRGKRHILSRRQEMLVNIHLHMPRVKHIISKSYAYIGTGATQRVKSFQNAFSFGTVSKKRKPSKENAQTCSTLERSESWTIRQAGSIYWTNVLRWKVNYTLVYRMLNYRVSLSFHHLTICKTIKQRSKMILEKQLNNSAKQWK